VPVQGKGAEDKIAEAIRIMNENKVADVLILARGGGSIEDLWPFNEEIVARAIYESQIPIISAVGHETDFTIADFVADLRAPTPSAAAELAQADIYEVTMKLNTYQDRLRQALKRKVEIMRLRYEKIMASRVFTDSTKGIKEKYLYIDSKTKEFEDAIQKKFKECQNRVINSITKLDALSPLKTLTRGYSVVEFTGKAVKSINEVKKDDNISIRLQDGYLGAKITDVIKN
jgi:exodeoxyribonuclease VII large subunit